MTSNAPQPPPYPWSKGDNDDHAALVVEVHVCRDSHGRVFSNHRLQEKLDEDTAMLWPGGGQAEVGFALLTEAVRREAILELLVALTEDPEFVTTLNALPPEERTARMGELVVGLRRQMDKVVARLAEGALEDAVLMMTGE